MTQTTNEILLSLESFSVSALILTPLFIFGILSKRISSQPNKNKLAGYLQITNSISGLIILTCLSFIASMLSALELLSYMSAAVIAISSFMIITMRPKKISILKHLVLLHEKPKCLNKHLNINELCIVGGLFNAASAAFAIVAPIMVFDTLNLTTSTAAYIPAIGSFVFYILTILSTDTVSFFIFFIMAIILTGSWNVGAYALMGELPGNTNTKLKKYVLVVKTYSMTIYLFFIGAGVYSFQYEFTILIYSLAMIASVYFTFIKKGQLNCYKKS